MSSAAALAAMSEGSTPDAPAPVPPLAGSSIATAAAPGMALTPNMALGIAFGGTALLVLHFRPKWAVGENKEIKWKAVAAASAVATVLCWYLTRRWS